MKTIHIASLVAAVILAGALPGCYERVISDNSVDAQFTRSMQPGAVHTGSGAGNPRDWNSQNDANSSNGNSNFRPNW